MNNNHQVLDAVLKNYGKLDKELYSSLEKVSEELFKEELTKLHLNDYTKRDSFYWNLQLMVEKCVAENGSTDDNEQFAELVVNKWNEISDLKINQSIVFNFIYNINFKFPNSRKAFVSICDGDLQGYKTFNSRSKLFMDLLIRFLICFYDNKQLNLIRQTIELLLPSLFEENTVTGFRDSIARLGFVNRKGINFGKMNAYKRSFGVSDLVYAEGMKTILLQALGAIEETEGLSVLKQRLEAKVLGEESYSNEEFVVDDLVDENAPEQTVQITKELEIGKFSSEEMNKEADLTKDDLVVALEKTLLSVQVALNIAKDQLKPQIPAATEPYQDKLSLAEEEIKRLKLALQLEKEKVELAEEKALATVLNAIGGESSNYLLSDLFEESQGKIPGNPNISAGRLINLFSSLGLAIGLEEHSNNHEIGDVFTVPKVELIKNYRIDGPVISQTDFIQVKLLKYGWTLNSKVVVQPLVTEVKEEA